MPGSSELCGLPPAPQRPDNRLPTALRTTGGDVQQHALDAYTAVVGRITSELTNIKHVSLAPEGRLHDLPFAALFDGKRFWPQCSITTRALVPGVSGPGTLASITFQATGWGRVWWSFSRWGIW